jgi:hypothetical protein
VTSADFAITVYALDFLYALGRRTFVLIITTLLRNGELYLKYG